MKYTQEQVIEMTKRFGVDAYMSYVAEAMNNYEYNSKKYTLSIGVASFWAGDSIDEVRKACHSFAINMTGLLYPPVVCGYIDNVFNNLVVTN